MSRVFLSLLALAVGLAPALAQQPPRRPPVVSPEVKDGKDGKKAVTFRVLAPKAEKVLLAAGDIPSEKSPPAPREMKKSVENVQNVLAIVVMSGKLTRVEFYAAVARRSQLSATCTGKSQ